jgi:UDP-N-acetylmuramyl pentapeptide phosphotransferase/UDP-N-acetylglucosamine-1-phosphate transferase
LGSEPGLAVAFAASGGLALALTPVAIRLATRLGFHDHPAGYKRHAAATPYGGGAAVLLALAPAALLLGGGAARWWAIVVGAAVLWTLGTVDDWRTVRPLWRVLGEVGVAGLLWASGLGWHITGVDAADLAITATWVVVVVNSFNLLDNIDGATAGTGAVAGAGIAVAAALEHRPELAALAASLSGACAGFLVFNLAGPARIFLGDGGSMVVGFLAAATAMSLPLERHVDSLELLAILPLVGVPLLDTALVCVSRRRRGVPLYRGGRDHLTHRLLPRLGSARAVTAALMTAQATACALGILAGRSGEGLVVAVAVAFAAFATACIVVMESTSWASPAHESGA